MKKVLFFGDVHAPAHDVRAWDQVLQVADDWKPDTVICLGDLCDFYAMSRHGRTPNKPVNFGLELSIAKLCIKELEQASGNADLVFCEGNHELRYLLRKQEKFPEDNRFETTKQLLEFGVRWTFVPYRQAFQLGHLFVTHDLEKCGKNAIQQALDDAQTNIVIGHTHRMGTHYAGDAFGRSHVAASFGWLGDVNQVDYKHRVRANREWQLGFGTARLDKEGIAYIQAVPIVDYSCVVEGKLYKG